MDTVISNKYSSVLNELDIEVSKKLEGEYTVDEIISQFKNFFFNKMFLDITAIKDYKDLTNLQKLSMSIDMDKVILLLDKDDSISSSEPFLAKLVNMGIYNFTKDQNNLMYLYTNPNVYRDVAYLQKIDTGENNNTTTDSSYSVSNKRIIGIKNITDSAGATSLIYMLKKVLSSYYSVMALEVDKRDLTYFKDKDTLTVKDDEINNIISKYNSIDIFLLDLNKSNKDYLCTDVLYLVEPSILKLNKLAIINPKIINDIKGKKVSDVELAESVFGIEPNEAIVHSVLVNYLANQRQGTQSTKTRAEVRGGGRKPWRQKGTGRARQGSIRAPQWIKGGIALGPKPRSYRYTVNKKERRLALKSALSYKVIDKELIIVDDIKFETSKTKEMMNFLKTLNIVNEKVLIVLTELDENICLSSRNMGNVKVIRTDEVNTLDVVTADKMVITASALNKLQEALSNE